MDFNDFSLSWRQHVKVPDAHRKLQQHFSQMSKFFDRRATIDLRLCDEYAWMRLFARENDMSCSCIEPGYGWDGCSHRDWYFAEYHEYLEQLTARNDDFFFGLESDPGELGLSLDGEWDCISRAEKSRSAAFLHRKRLCRSHRSNGRSRPRRGGRHKVGERLVSDFD